MIVPKLALLLALANFSYAFYDENNFECLQKALSEGVPSLDIPSYDPWVDDEILIGIIGWYYFRLQNVTWYNIPKWNFTKLNLIKEDGDSQHWEYSMNWDNLNLTSHYDTSFIDLEGNIFITMKNLSCSGICIYRKGSADTNDRVTSLDIDWQYGDIDVHVTDLDVWEDLADGFVESVLKLLLSEDGLAIGIRNDMNEEWLEKPEKIAALKEWCANGTLSG